MFRAHCSSENYSRFCRRSHPLNFVVQPVTGNHDDDGQDDPDSVGHGFTTKDATKQTADMVGRRY
jgi:hypothetical protein